MLSREELEIVVLHCESGPEDSADDSVGVSKLYKHGLEALAEIDVYKKESRLKNDNINFLKAKISELEGKVERLEKERQVKKESNKYKLEG